MTASFADNEIWHVLIATDDMKRMNVEQLDDAFRLSLVDASTLVWKAGMKTWQRLGAVAGIDDEPAPDPFASSRHAPPPPPPPRPAPRAEAAMAPQRAPTQPGRHARHAAYHAPSSHAHAAYSAQPARHVPAGYPQHAAPQAYAGYPAQAAYQAAGHGFTQPLVAPVFSPAARSADPYTLPRRRVAIPSEVDFRRSSGVRWGRWLVALLLVTGGVLGAYRQNLLREGARRIGFESRYLAGEQRATAWVTAQAPYEVKTALTRLKLLPGPNAVPPPAPVAVKLAPASPPAAPTTTPSSDAKPQEPEVKTVALDSLPVLAAETADAEPASPATTTPPATASRLAAPVAPASRPAAPVAPAAPGVSKAKSAAARVTLDEDAAPAKPAAKSRAEKPKAEPKSKAKPPAEPPPPANEGFLNAAIRSAIAKDKQK